MSIRFRSAMMWLLLVALPLQGFAAATMLNCGPNHQQMWEASVGARAERSDPAAHGDHQHPMDSADAHQKAEAGDPADEGGSLHHLGKLSTFKCSACAACCMGVALPPSPLAFASSPPASVPTPNVSAPHVDFVSNGLDRPPRLFLA